MALQLPPAIFGRYLIRGDLCVGTKGIFVTYKVPELGCFGQCFPEFTPLFDAENELLFRTGNGWKLRPEWQLLV